MRDALLAAVAMTAALVFAQSPAMAYTEVARLDVLSGG